MSLRRRIALVCAGAAAVAVVLASVLTYVLTSHQLHGQVDAQLRDRGRESRTVFRLIDLAPPGSPVRRLLPASAAAGTSALSADERRLERDLRRLSPAQRAQLGLTGLPSGPREIRTANRPDPFGSLPLRPNQVRGYQQLVDSSGRVVAHSPGGVTLPVDAHTHALARSGGRPYLVSVQVNGMHLRVLAEPINGGAVQYAQSLADVDHLLGRLRLILILLSAGAVVLAALLARVIAGAALSPVKRLTQATEHVTRTRDLSRRIKRAGDDEIGRLSTSFNTMLDTLERTMRALDASAAAQRQLVADASHELRTPVTSLRTNIEFLQQAGDMDEVERERVLADLVEQVEELTTLMNDLIDLARGDERVEQREDVRLDLLVEEAIARVRRRTPEREIEVELAETVVVAAPDRLDRAVNNLLDNAVKYSPAGTPIAIALHDGELTVRDHGPGISETDLPHVFDRFYRGADARARPGSGLGLAIVRQVAESLGGRIAAERVPSGGTLMRLRLPVAPRERDEQAEGQAAGDGAILQRSLRTPA